MTDVEALLDDVLVECKPLIEFAGEAKLGRGHSSTQLDVRDGEVYVNLYVASDRGIIVIGYAPGIAYEDTAYCGDIEETHKAMNGLSRHMESRYSETTSTFSVIDDGLRN